MGQPLEVDNDQLRANTEADPLTSTWEVAEELNINNTMVIQHFWIKLERWESSISGCLMSWLKLKKKPSLWSVIFSYTQQEIISWSDCDVQWKVDFIRQLAMTSLVAGPRRSSKALPKAKLAPKKRSWSLFHDLLPVWSTTAFWTVVKPLHLRGMLRKSMRCTRKCNTCGQHWPTERLQFFRTTPHRTSYSYSLKSWKNWVTRFCLICHLHLTSCQDYHFFKFLDNFLQGKCFHNQQEAESAFQEFTESWSMRFYAMGINQLISHWQKCADCNGSYFE